MPSEIHGLGLFADENISKKEVVYSINSYLDLILSQKKYDKLYDNEKRTIKHYGYFDKENSCWHLSFDDIRFCNHDANGNLALCGNALITKKDIKKGAEILQDYNEFETLRKNAPE